MKLPLALAMACAMACSSQALSVKQLEVVILEANYATGKDGSWRRDLRAALDRLDTRCAKSLDDRIAILELVSHEDPGAKSPSTEAAARYLVAEGLSSTSVYQDRSSIEQLKHRSVSGERTSPLSAGMVRVEISCTSSK